MYPFLPYKLLGTMVQNTIFSAISWFEARWPSVPSIIYPLHGIIYCSHQESHSWKLLVFSFSQVFCSSSHSSPLRWWCVILFSKVSPKGLEGLAILLNHSTLVTGQIFNLSKSQLIFNHNAHYIQKQTVYSYMQIPELSNELLYIGMPLPFGRGKSKFFHYLLFRIHKRQKTRGHISFSGW